MVSIETAVLTPKTAPAREKANNFDTISTFIFLAFQNLKALAKVDRKADSLLVPKAIWGGKPTAKYAGKEIRPPPPEIASTTEAIKQQTARIKNLIGSKS